MFCEGVKDLLSYGAVGSFTLKEALPKQNLDLYLFTIRSILYQFNSMSSFLVQSFELYCLFEGEVYFEVQATELPVSVCISLCDFTQVRLVLRCRPPLSPPVNLCWADQLCFMLQQTATSKDQCSNFIGRVTVILKYLILQMYDATHSLACCVLQLGALFETHV